MGSGPENVGSNRRRHHARVSLEFDGGIIDRLQPAEALLATLGFECISGCLLGLIILAINAITSSKLGIAGAALVVLFDLLTANTLPYFFLHFSPVSHCRLQNLDLQGASPSLPTPLEALSFDLLAVLICLAAITWVLRRTDINYTAQL